MLQLIIEWEAFSVLRFLLHLLLKDDLSGFVLHKHELGIYRCVEHVGVLCDETKEALKFLLRSLEVPLDPLILSDFLKVVLVPLLKSLELPELRLKELPYTPVLQVLHEVAPDLVSLRFVQELVPLNRHLVVILYTFYMH